MPRRVGPGSGARARQCHSQDQRGDARRRKKVRRGVAALVLLPERVCSSCSTRRQKEYGCNARQDETGAWIDKAVAPVVFDGAESWACPRRPVKDEPAAFAELLGLYALYTEGVLADDGALMGQAVKYVTLMRLVHSVVAECQAQQREEARKRS